MGVLAEKQGDSGGGPTTDSAVGGRPAKSWHGGGGYGVMASSTQVGVIVGGRHSGNGQHSVVVLDARRARDRGLLTSLSRRCCWVAIEERGREMDASDSA